MERDWHATVPMQPDASLTGAACKAGSFGRPHHSSEGCGAVKPKLLRCPRYCATCSKPHHDEEQQQIEMNNTNREKACRFEAG